MEGNQATLDFYQCAQKPGQLASDYAKELKTLWRKMRKILKAEDPGFAYLEATLGKHHELVFRFIDGLREPRVKEELWEWHKSYQRPSNRAPRFGEASQAAFQTELLNFIIQELHGNSSQ